MLDWSTLGILVSAILVPFATGLVFLFNRLGNIIKTIYEVKDKILSKLEYHEQHDDRRFDEVKKDTWLIRLRLATIDGKVNGTYQKDQDRDVRGETPPQG